MSNTDYKMLDIGSYNSVNDASSSIGAIQNGSVMVWVREVEGKLILQEGPLPGAEIDLTSDEFVIGRDPRVDFVINHPAVSGRHAFITCQRDVFSIEDLRSTNGTFLNGKRLVKREIINSGDEIRLGRSIFLHFEAPGVDDTIVERGVNLRRVQLEEMTILDEKPPGSSSQIEKKKLLFPNVNGNLRQGDIVAGDKNSIGDVSGSAAIAIGPGARATTIYQGLSEEGVAQLLVELKKIEHPEVWDGRIPYLGLKSFRESDAEFFFGRDRLVEELLKRADSSSFIVIHGPSGSGKSSLARAGLFPALRDGRLKRSEAWMLAAMRPKRNPIEQLAETLARAAKSPLAGKTVLLEGLTDPSALSRQVEVLLTDDPQQRFVLLVDQFEEIFTQTKNDKVRKAFVNLLTTAAQAEGGRTIIVISLRTDFISHCARYPELLSMMSQQLQAVGAMEPRELTEAITRPALEVGAEIDPALVSQIVMDMKGEPGALPLMSIVLRNLFEVEKTEEGEPMDMTLPEYLNLGGVDTALERHADRVLSGLQDEQKSLARNVFAKLVELEQGGAVTRRTAILENLIPTGFKPEEVKKVVGVLAEERANLITIGGLVREEDGETTPQTSVTLAHEKLIDAWPWLRELIDQKRETIDLQNDIYEDAYAWMFEGAEDASYLYEGVQLLRVEEKRKQLQPDLDDLSLRFIEAGLELRERSESE